MGNGQCPDCCGVPESWFGHPLHMTPKTIGHRKNCQRAASIKELGGNPLMIGQFKSDVEWENYISPEGFWGTRVKQPGVPPCPRMAAMEKELDRAWWDAMKEAGIV